MAGQVCGPPRPPSSRLYSGCPGLRRLHVDLPGKPAACNYGLLSHGFGPLRHGFGPLRLGFGLLRGHSGLLFWETWLSFPNLGKDPTTRSTNGFLILWPNPAECRIRIAASTLLDPSRGIWVRGLLRSSGQAVSKPVARGLRLWGLSVEGLAVLASDVSWSWCSCLSTPVFMCPCHRRRRQWPMTWPQEWLCGSAALVV